MKAPQWLIEDWKKAFKLACVVVNLVGVGVMGVFTIWPDSLLYLWGAMPEEVRQLIPDRLATLIAMVLFIGSTIARLVKQRAQNEQPKPIEQKPDEETGA